MFYLISPPQSCLQCFESIKILPCSDLCEHQSPRSFGLLHSILFVAISLHHRKALSYCGLGAALPSSDPGGNCSCVWTQNRNNTGSWRACSALRVTPRAVSLGSLCPQSVSLLSDFLVDVTLCAAQQCPLPCLPKRPSGLLCFHWPAEIPLNCLCILSCGLSVLAFHLLLMWKVYTFEILIFQVVRLVSSVFP